MLRFPDDGFSEDNKASPHMESHHQKEFLSKSLYHMPISSEICTEKIKNNCLQKDGVPNNATYATHIMKSSSPTSSLGESVYVPELVNQIPVSHGQQMHTMTSTTDINFYSFPDFISDQEKNILSDSEKLLRSKENDIYNNEYNHIHDVFAIRKYYHPLFAHGICRWPGCEVDLEDIASFVK